MSQLRQWKNNLVQVNELENPLDYFQIDEFIRFYAGEIIDITPVEESDHIKPLSSEKQLVVIKLMNQQSEFISTEIENLEENEEDKKNDLILAQKILDKMKENISRMTIADIKKNWSISFGAIRKWCGERFLTFVKVDKANGNDISRMIGSFVGGILNI
ncbi:hypothetical protein [Carboxylicivirga marina]|uniref:hypothetical protein n=1 Tax=Carboxylicivirga marina TaxID=2800988 RepID=UPI002599C1E3|nr:hypothetical protein [uncultured Carboxylicivirga sp.]